MAKKTFKVRALQKGFGGVPPSRRVVGEVFRVAPNKHGEFPQAKWYVRVDSAQPEVRPERKEQTESQQFEKRNGDLVPVDRRNSADAFKGVEPDTSYLGQVPALGGESSDASDSGESSDASDSGESTDASNSGDDLT